MTPKILSQLPTRNKGCKGLCLKLYPKENIMSIHSRFIYKDTKKCTVCEITLLHTDQEKEIFCKCCKQRLRYRPLTPIKDIVERESKIKRIE